MTRPLSYLSDDKLDELLSGALNIAMRSMQRYGANHKRPWRGLEWFVSHVSVHQLVEEYGARHARPCAKRYGAPGRGYVPHGTGQVVSYVRKAR